MTSAATEQTEFAGVDGQKTSPPYSPRDVYYSQDGSHTGFDQSYTGDSILIRTVAICRLPPNILPRELNNFLTFLDGYQASQLVKDDTSDEVVEGRALFDTPEHAQEAISRIDGKIEFERGYLLTAHPAPEELDIDTDIAAETERLPSPPALPPNDVSNHHSGGVAMMPQRVTHPAALYTMPTAGGGNTLVSLQPMAMSPFSTGHAYAPVRNEKDNPPINTLFIGNLGENVDENELQAIFGSQPGFMQLKVVRSPKGTSAFVEFIDVPSAQMCHDCQQGLMLATSDRGPIRVQYSKNPFGCKRDGINGTLTTNGVPTISTGAGSSPMMSSPVIAAGGLGGGATYPAHYVTMTQAGPMMTTAFPQHFASAHYMHRTHVNAPIVTMPMMTARVGGDVGGRRVAGL